LLKGGLIATTRERSANCRHTCFFGRRVAVDYSSILELDVPVES
jgi:hypothetical protein